jgi:hypothetical protein
MHDLDALLKEYEQPKKSNIKENLPQQQKLPIPNLSAFPKHDLSVSDNRKGNIPNFSYATEQRRPSILKQPPKPSVDQSFDIDTILQGRSIQPQPPSKILHPIAPAKNSASSVRRDSLSDWLNEDRATTKNYPNQPSSNLFPQKVTTNMPGKPAIDLNPDDFFSNTNNRDQSAAKGPFSTTKTSAKQYYLGNSRYKPGPFYSYNKKISFYSLRISGINPKQAGRGDGTNWFTDPSNNSNSASMYFSE